MKVGIFQYEKYYEIVQQYRRIKSVFGEEIAKFFLLSGNLFVDNKEEIRKTLKEDKKFIANHQTDLENFNDAIISIKKAKVFYNEYKEYKDETMIEKLQRQFKMLNQSQIKEMLTDTKNSFIYQAPSLKVYRDFNNNFGALKNTKKLIAKGVTSSLVAVAGVGSIFGSIKMYNRLFELISPELIANIRNNLQINVCPELVLKLLLFASFGLIFVGGLPFLKTVFDGINNNKEIDEIGKQYDLKIR